MLFCIHSIRLSSGGAWRLEEPAAAKCDCLPLDGEPCCSINDNSRTARFGGCPSHVRPLTTGDRENSDTSNERSYAAHYMSMIAEYRGPSVNHETVQISGIYQMIRRHFCDKKIVISPMLFRAVYIASKIQPLEIRTAGRPVRDSFHASKRRSGSIGSLNLRQSKKM